MQNFNLSPLSPPLNTTFRDKREHWYVRIADKQTNKQIGFPCLFLTTKAALIPFYLQGNGMIVWYQAEQSKEQLSSEKGEAILWRREQKNYPLMSRCRTNWMVSQKLSMLQGNVCVSPLSYERPFAPRHPERSNPAVGRCGHKGKAERKICK